MSSAKAGEPFKFPTVSIEFVETIERSLKKSSSGHDEIVISILKEFIHLLGPVVLKDVIKASNRESSQIVK